MITDGSGHSPTEGNQAEVVNEDTARDIIDRILRVPIKYRDFKVSIDQARELYSIHDSLLSVLLDLGIPHRGIGADRKFNGADLENIGNALGLHFPGWRLLRMLAIAFGEMHSPTGASYRVRSTSKCPLPRHHGSCDVAPSTMLMKSGALVLERDSSGLTVEVRLQGIGQPLGAVIEPIVQVAAGLTFHYLPNELKADVGFAMETGLADCRLSTAVLLANSELIDRPLRPASGLIMSVPLMMGHTWLQVNIADEWLSIDPFFLIALARWHIIDSQAWPPDSRPGHVYWTVQPESVTDVFLTTDHGAPSQANVRVLNWRDIFAVG